VQQALEVVQSYTIPALHVASLVATVDVLAALAHQALQNDWIRPQFSSSVDNSGDEKSLTIKGLRHVILEQKIGTLAVVANDVKVNQQDGYCMIITGPNMGGKSTFMLSIGLAVLMAQLGSFIPATSAVMPIYDQLFVRSGSSDLSAIGFSSFMAEMVDTADIIRHATGQSLILIDEIGRGTSTSDGFGLAWAILEELALSNKATVFCATHFHELNNLTNDGLHDVNPIKLEECHRLIFKSLHVDAHIDKKFQDVFMLYRVKEGSCSRSYGIHVAKVAKFPEEIISKALEIEENLNFTMDKRQNKRMISAIGDDHTPKKFARPELKPADLELIDQEPL
jgi:DNA mismatch repair protein MSH2